MENVKRSVMVWLSVIGAVLTAVLSPIMSNAQSFQTAELDVDFTRSYTQVWSDVGSGAAANVSFWRPEPPQGWFRVGHHMRRGHGNPADSTIILRQRTSGALAQPVDYFLIWDDTGSGAASDVSVWRPACPNGYRAMGDLTNSSHSKPSLNEVVCVRETALTAAQSGNEIWNDTGSGAARDFAAWGIMPPADDANFTYASSGLFYGAPFRNRPNPSSVGGLWAARLPKASGGTGSLGTASSGAADQQFWDAIKNSSNAQDYQSYLSAFPNGQFAPLARFKMGQLAPANPVSTGGGVPIGAANADQQFWESVKNSQQASDFQGYLNAFPNGQFAALARFRMGQLPSSNPGSISIGVGNSADQQFWDSVKNSQQASDYQGYLNAFPNGQFAALARFKMGQLSAPNPGNLGGATSQNSSFLNQVAATNRAKLPIIVGDIQLFDAVSVCRSGCQQSDGNNESVVIRGRTPNIAKQNVSIGRVEQSLKPALLTGYCGSPEQQNNVVFAIDIDDMFSQKVGNFFINSRDCGGSAGTVGSQGPGNLAASANAAFLNKSAAESRATLPITLGQIQLFDAVSHCSSGCQVANNTESVTIRAKTPNLSRQNTSIRQIDQFLRPALTKTYCGTPEQRRNVPMGVEVEDMFSQNIGSFFVTSSDCGGNAGNTLGTPSATGFQQVIATAQPGALSEIARARSFFIVSSDFSIKSKISAAIIKALPQMRAATSEQTADFLIGFEMTDRTTGLVTANDASNPNLKGELIVFTLNGGTQNIRILFRVTKERGFGVFSATPDENAAKEFAKQFAKVIN